METCNTLFNITEKNDKFSYNPGSWYKTITVSSGAYEISQISSEIARLMKNQGDEPKNIVIDIQKQRLNLKITTRLISQLIIHLESYWVSPQKRLKLMWRFTVIMSFKYPQA